MTFQHRNCVQIFTDGSKVDEKVAAAAVPSLASSSSFSFLLRDHCSIHTAELQPILFALKLAYQSRARKFFILSYLLCALHVLEKLKPNHPLLIQIQDMLHETDVDPRGKTLCGFLDMFVFEEMMPLIELLKKLLTRNLQMTLCPFQT